MMTAAAMAMKVLCAQDASAPAPPPPGVAMETAVIPVKTLTGDSFNRLIRLLGVFKTANLSGDEKLRTVVVYAPKDVIAQIRQVVDQLDRPGSEAAIGRNIQMTLSFLLCSNKPGGPASALPADLEPVAKQLRAATQYKNIELWDVMPLRLQEGRQSTDSVRLATPAGMVLPANQAAMVMINITPESVTRKDNGRSVRFSDVRIGFRIPVGTSGNFTFSDESLNTAGDFLEGQKTVLGKVSGIEASTAIFVVIDVKVLD
jgi:hypothetical protein